MITPASLVERYYEVVADLHAAPDALRELLHPDVQIVERPNAINPRGTVRDREQALAAYAAGKRLLAEQQITLHEVLVRGERVVTRGTWRGVLAARAGPLEPGTTLVAQIAGFTRVAAGAILHHETFDCYQAPALPKPD